MSAIDICLAVIAWTLCLGAIWANWHDKWAHTVTQVVATVVLLMVGAIFTLALHEGHEAGIRDHRACVKTFGQDSEACVH